MLTHRLKLWLTILLLALWLTSCNNLMDQFQSISEVVEEEEEVPLNQITVYSTLPEDYLEPFQAEYPDIQVEFYRESNGVILDRLLAEAADPQADVIWGLGATSLMIAEWHELVTPYSPAGLERVQDKFRDLNNPPYWVGIDVGMSALCVNTAKLAELDLPKPESWQDLLKPIYRGHLVMPNPNSSGTAQQALAGIFELYGEVEAWDYLDRLHRNMVVYTDSGGQPCRLADSGEIPIGISFEIAAISLENVEAVFPTEGVGWALEANALVKKDQIKPAARTFLDWAISYSAMEVYAENRAVISVDIGRPPPEGMPDDPASLLLDLDIPWLAANQERVLAEWLERYGDKIEQSEES